MVHGQKQCCLYLQIKLHYICVYKFHNLNSLWPVLCIFELTFMLHTTKLYAIKQVDVHSDCYITVMMYFRQKQCRLYLQMKLHFICVYKFYSIFHAFFSFEAPHRPVTQLYHLLKHNLRQDSIYIFFVIEFQHNIQLYVVYLLNNFYFTTA